MNIRKNQIIIERMKISTSTEIQKSSPQVKNLCDQIEEEASLITDVIACVPEILRGKKLTQTDRDILEFSLYFLSIDKENRALRDFEYISLLNRIEVFYDFCEKISMLNEKNSAISELTIEFMMFRKYGQKSLNHRKNLNNSV